MAVTARLYGRVFLAAFNKEIDWVDDVHKAMLVTSLYTPDQDAHDYKNDVTNEVVGTGYVAGGNVIGSRTITYTGATNKITLDGADVQWPNSTITARTAVVYDDAPVGDAAKPLIGYQQSDIDLSSNNGTWEIVWHANGIVEITVT